MVILAPVVVVKLDDSSNARADLDLATSDCRTGTLVRLEVGTLQPPLWLSDAARTDLKYQVCAPSSKLADAWTLALLGGAE